MFLQQSYQGSLNEVQMISDIIFEASKGENIKVNSSMKVNTTWQLSGMDIHYNDVSYKKNNCKV